MLSSIRRYLTFANVAMTLAIVLAMSGGAYAAGKFVITSTKQIKPSVLKQLKGKAGAPGAQGPAGSQGAPGVNGKDGAPGFEGKQGPEGKEGKEGKEGSPWTGGGVLPEGQTESGVWAVIGTASTSGQVSAAPISFNIPLKVAPATHFIGQEQGEGEAQELKPFPEGCKGTAENPATVSNPVARPGNLCVYAHETFNAKPYLGIGFINVEAGGIGAGKTGTALFIESEEGKYAADGVWAVTAE
jgi:hypothetical protein